MIPIVLVSVALGAVLLWALYADPTPLEPISQPRRLVSPLSAADIQRHDAPLVVAGYDPRWIDHHLSQVAGLVTGNGAHARTSAPATDPPAMKQDATGPTATDRNETGRTATDLAAARAAARLEEPPRSVLDE